MADTFQPSLAPQARDSSNILLDVTGSALIGSWLTMILCGVAMAQTYSYFNEYRDDDIWTKASVWFVTLLNILHSICVCMATYSVRIVSTHISNLTASNWTLQAVMATHLAIAIFVLLYFTKTCFHLLADKKVQKPVITVIVVTIVLHVGFGIALIVKSSEQNSLLRLYSLRSTIIIPLTATQVAADSLVSVTLCLALPKDSVVFRQTKSVVYTIVICAVSRGILTSAAAMVQLLTFSVAPHALWVACAEFVAAGCYANSFLSALTIRKRIRKQAAGNIAMQTMSIPLRSYIPSASMSNDDREDIAGAIPKSTPTDARTKVDVFGLHTCDDAFEKA